MPGIARTTGRPEPIPGSKGKRSPIEAGRRSGSWKHSSSAGPGRDGTTETEGCPNVRVRGRVRVESSKRHARERGSTEVHPLQELVLPSVSQRIHPTTAPSPRNLSEISIPFERSRSAIADRSLAGFSIRRSSRPVASYGKLDRICTQVVWQRDPSRQIERSRRSHEGDGTALQLAHAAGRTRSGPTGREGSRREEEGK